MRTQARILVAALGSWLRLLTRTPLLRPIRTSIALRRSHSERYLRSARPGITSAHGQLVSLAEGFSFTEGPAADRHGNVFFTDQPNDRIYRWDAGTGKVTLFLEGTGRANGMIFDREETSSPLRTCMESCGRSVRMEATRCWSTTTRASC